MAKGTRYTPEFEAKAVRLLTESRGSYSSETKAIEQVAKDLGSRRRRCAVGATRGRHGRGGDQADMARFHVRTPCFLVYAHLPLRWIISAHEGNTMTTSSSLCYRKNYPHIRREMLPRILLIPMPHVYRYAA